MLGLGRWIAHCGRCGIREFTCISANFPMTIELLLEEVELGVLAIRSRVVADLSRSSTGSTSLGVKLRHRKTVLRRSSRLNHSQCAFDGGRHLNPSSDSISVS